MSLYNVLKAGGTSVRDGPSLEIVVNEATRIHEEALSKDRDATTYLIVSGTGKREDRQISDKNTNLLEDVFEGKNVEINSKEIRERELGIFSYFGIDGQGTVEKYLNDVYTAFLGIENSDEKYSQIVLSGGERLKAAQATKVLNLMNPGIALHLDYDQTGFLTENGLRNATLTDETFDSVKDSLVVPQHYGKIVVLGGFMGIDKETKKLSSLERGGSDSHAVGIGAGVGAKQVFIYSDSSLRRADPRIVPYAEIIPRVNFDEMSEFIGLGAGLLAYNANRIAKQNGIELVLKNTFNLNENPTIVSSESNGKYLGIKGVAACEAGLLGIDNLPQDPGKYMKVIEILHRYGVPLTSEAGNESKSSMGLVETQQGNLRSNIKDILYDIGQLGLEVSYEPQATRIGLVGQGLQNHPKGVVAMGTIFDEYDLPLDSISKPKDGVALVAYTERTDLVPNLVKELHDYLFMSPDITQKSKLGANSSVLKN